ncbi:hypothetical protein DFH28DRAFT_1085210 [Melampsora americana]|nr:hypothetical protein DFH28DRAFT_1085210 [Melampsora americana]
MRKMFLIAALMCAAALFPFQLNHTQSQPNPTQSQSNLTQSQRNTTQSQPGQQLTEIRSAILSSNQAKNANCGINRHQMEQLIDFHETQQHVLAMMAMDFGISVSVIEVMWGRRIAVWMATAWNRYLQMPYAKALFKMGNKLSFAWKHMSLEEKAAFKAPIPDVHLDFGDKVIVQPRIIVKSDSTSLPKAEKQVQLYLTNLIAKHLAAHNFQICVVTPRAQCGVELITKTAGTQEFGAQLQEYVTGNTTKALEAKRHCGGMFYIMLTKVCDAEGNSKVIRKEVSARLGCLVDEPTNTVLRKWPWTDADSVLETFNLHVSFTRPDTKLDINCLKRPLACLSGRDSCLIIFKLEQGGISLLLIQSPVLQSGSPEASRMI